MDSSIQEQIDSFCQQGDEHLNAGAFKKALKAYESALELIPTPRENYSQSTWIFTAIGEVHYFCERYLKALQSFHCALQCPDGLGNPLIHFRLGQVHYDIYELEKAADELTRAYMGAGREIFDDEDPKYYTFLKTPISIEE